MENDIIDTIVDKLLQEAITKNKQEILKLETQAQESSKTLAKIYSDNREYTISYQKACPHPVTEKILVSHTSGGYDHVSEDNYNIVYTRCSRLQISKRNIRMKDNFALQLINKQIINTQEHIKEYNDIIIENESNIVRYKEYISGAEDKLSDLLDAARVIEAAYA
jgi:hypothetical protein